MIAMTRVHFSALGIFLACGDPIGRSASERKNEIRSWLFVRDFARGLFALSRSIGDIETNGDRIQGVVYRT